VTVENKKIEAPITEREKFLASLAITLIAEIGAVLESLLK